MINNQSLADVRKKAIGNSKLESYPDFNAMQSHVHFPLLLYSLLLHVFTGYTITGTAIGSTQVLFLVLQHSIGYV